ncbi:MAG TPA: DUF4388 domain-containing protein [Acidimicrobiia bacterium]|nr:DUF4388 domain-containing protein [Acidimicrobiia bacterium]
MMLSGNLSNWPVTDLLQIMKVTQKTGALRIDGARPGAVHFVTGQIVGAAVAGQRVPTNAEEARRISIDALHVLVSNSDGSFLVADSEISEGVPGWEVADLMSEVERLRMIESEIKREGIEEATPLRLMAAAASPVTLQADDWEALAALVPAFTISSLEVDLGRSRALAVAATLISRGLALADGSLAGLESEPISEAISSTGEPPVLDWLSESPAEGDMDLSTDFSIPLQAVHGEDEHEEVASERRSLKGVVASPGTTLVSGVLDDMRKLRTNNG